MEPDWSFDGGRACLDLVNTLRDRLIGGRELLTDTGALADWLLAAGLLGHRPRVRATELPAARELREAIDRVLTAPCPTSADVRLLNDTAAGTEPLPPRLHRCPDGTLRRETPRPREPVRTALAAVALDAIELVTGADRVRICAGEDCALRFVDTSPKGNRQWCSMARCGNRAKARAHYQRHRQ
ncbi:CGNR zinc finger domain-containing protein [Sciscionella sediminilitoris]|uniref:CGNR zinc finger domain-containing protein n=1 Tax=Sciscionella sediminilitoris TaxID=1445613 RepID=UPI0004DF2855|nr:ABATE domain-containing protein [Sciscionella sp. SE31]